MGGPEIQAMRREEILKVCKIEARQHVACDCTRIRVAGMKTQTLLSASRENVRGIIRHNEAS
jgi:hypothetical protein